MFYRESMVQICAVLFVIVIRSETGNVKCIYQIKLISMAAIMRYRMGTVSLPVDGRITHN